MAQCQGGRSLGERVHELRERVRELEKWNDGTLSDGDEKHKRGSEVEDC